MEHGALAISARRDQWDHRTQQPGCTKGVYKNAQCLANTYALRLIMSCMVNPYHRMEYFDV